MASSDPRNVGLSKNCMEALINLTETEANVKSDIHMCQDHKDKKSCEYLKDFGSRVRNKARENVSKWCFIRPQRARSEGK